MNRLLELLEEIEGISEFALTPARWSKDWFRAKFREVLANARAAREEAWDYKLLFEDQIPESDN